MHFDDYVNKQLLLIKMRQDEKTKNLLHQKFILVLFDSHPCARRQNKIQALKSSK